MPSLVGDYATFQAETDRLRALLASTNALAPVHRKHIAEIALLRLAILIENTMRSFCTKMVCGASYIDGTAPALLSKQNNGSQAVHAMRFQNRPNPINLKWNEGKALRANIEKLIDAVDPVYGHLINHASFLTDVRYIRNHIAHRNSDSRKNYVKVVRRYYGANVRGVTVGNLLISPKLSTPPILETHIITSRVMMKDLMRG